MPMARAVSCPKGAGARDPRQAADTIAVSPRRRLASVEALCEGVLAREGAVRRQGSGADA